MKVYSLIKKKKIHSFLDMLRCIPIAFKAFTTEYIHKHEANSIVTAIYHLYVTYLREIFEDINTTTHVHKFHSEGATCNTKDLEDVETTRVITLTTRITKSF